MVQNISRVVDFTSVYLCNKKRKMVCIYLASTDSDYGSAGELFRAYAISLHINLDFQHFDAELDDLKKMYAKPYGGIILASEQEKVFGCVALRKFNGQTGEIKRMYIQPGYQKRGIGKMLLEQALLLAKECNYTIVKLDTLNSMIPAINLYKEAGFYKTSPYYHNPIETAIYFEKVIK